MMMQHLQPARAVEPALWQCPSCQRFFFAVPHASGEHSYPLMGASGRTYMVCVDCAAKATMTWWRGWSEVPLNG